MKGILKIYHPEETLKYNISTTYCKAVYSNKQHFLEVEINTDDGLDHVDDDSLQYNFPQLTLQVFDFPVKNGDLEHEVIRIDDEVAQDYTEVDLYDDDDAFLSDNELVFDKDENEVLHLTWKGNIDDFFTGLPHPIPFRLKCDFREESIEIEEE